MRILDKNTDFYDYWQNIYPDKSITFDRTDSFLLTKQDLIRDLAYGRDVFVGAEQFILLQVCNTFWLFLATVTEVDKDARIKDCAFELLQRWSNYHKQKVLMRLDVIRFPYRVWRQFYTWEKDVAHQVDVHKKLPTLIAAIDQNEFEVYRAINSHTSSRLIRGELVREEKHLPLLIASGLAELIDPLEIYLAFEEYFSLEKTASERTESVGLTNDEKVVNHGFDVKTSFRGK